MPHDNGIDSITEDGLKNVLTQHVNVQEAKIFGSRAIGNYKASSDIDLALFGPVDFLEVEEIRSNLDELPIVLKCDVVAYHSIRNPKLRDHIDRVGYVIYTRS